MTTVRVELLDVYCADTEDVTGADDFYLVGALVGGGATKGILTRPVKINDNQQKSFYPEDSLLFEGVLYPGESIQGGLKAYDEDAGKDWSRHGETVQEITGYVSDALSLFGSTGAIAGKILSVATTGVGILATMDKDDLLGSAELEIPAIGPSYEILEWKMLETGTIGYSTWDYTVRLQISRRH
ncbi:hypothetical protein PMG71_16845 [Roseofilum sp. BLCC_M154]|uniref:Uncharacterized protein n=1 Tax=Roseofilum acuticapitatum BLCC-M154 TaxID=3022444 RepID=A0ABT7AW06_9CYAN|nr:hypothetical protein [Roseofilum acuticapitatum]MDJ1171099.1 hypothetical protein [Roseofilum acuticapitatum BLCC-M154]